jgi:hypothetical protein
MKTKLKTISPKQAKELLKKNIRNRSISSATVKKYTILMKKKAWMVTGDSIKISADGNLMDGQHRLLAVVASGVPLQTVIVEGVEDMAFRVLDSGYSRDARHIVDSFGIPHPKTAATAIRILKAFYTCSEMRSVKSVKEAAPYADNANDLLRACNIKRPGLFKNIVIKLHEMKVVPRWSNIELGITRPTCVGACYVSCDIQGKDITDIFLEWLKNLILGLDLKETDSRFHLRLALASARRIRADLRLYADLKPMTGLVLAFDNQRRKTFALDPRKKTGHLYSPDFDKYRKKKNTVSP